MKQTKKWLAGLLCAVLLVGLLPAAAFAEGGGTALSKDGGLLAAGTYTLTENIQLSDNLTVNSPVTIDLQSHTISGNGKGSVITVSNGGKLTLNDTGGNGKITGGEVTKETGTWTHGGGVSVLNGGEFIMNGGSITGNTEGGGDAGGVCVTNKGTFTMTGGSITGNTGRGLNVNNATAIITGGTISQNDNTDKSGGGVHVVYGSTVEMTGVTISNNFAGDGGGAFVGSGSTLSMTNCTVTGNTATNGGGVFVSNDNNDNNNNGVCAFTMSGGSITGNTATGYGGGVVLSDGDASFTVSGAAQITGNTATDGTNNVWVSSGNPMAASGLTNGAKIGVSWWAKLNDNDGPVTICTGTADTSCFSSDSADYEVAAGDNSVILKKASSGTDPDPEPPEGTLTRAQFALIIYQHESFGLAGETGTHTFTDVDSCTAEEKTAIGVLSTKEILTGTSPNTFNPGDTLTRGQAATAIYRAAGNPDMGTVSGLPFQDVAESYYVGAVTNLWAMGVLDQTDVIDGSQFKPDDLADEATVQKWLAEYDKILPATGLTRAQFAVLLQKNASLGFAGKTSGSASKFTDVNSCTPDQKNAIGVLTDAGVLNGPKPNIINPNGAVTRGAAAVMIWRAAGEPTDGAAPTHSAATDVADHWCREAVNGLLAIGVLTSDDLVVAGTAPQRFKPDAPADEATVQKWLAAYDAYKARQGTTDPGTNPNPNPGGGGGVYVPPNSTTTTTTTNPDGSTTTTTTDHSTGTVTEVTKNPDGSSTTTVKKPDGTCTETTENPGGSELVKETRPDGSSETRITAPDGSTGTTTVDKDGQVTADVELKLPDLNMGEEAYPVAPVPELPVTTDREKAPVVTIGLPGDITIRVEIPVKDVTPGTVAVMVNADGSETVVKTSLTTESGVTVTVSDGATVKIMDNSKQFSDVPEDHWASGAVDFASSRELLNGTSATEAAFSPEADMTRAMLMTVLARFDGVDTEGGSVWYERGMEWAKASGVSDGTAPNSSITREQMVVMMYRYAGSPAASGSLDGFTDANEVSDYALDAMRWAVGTGIIGGMGGGVLSPGGNATRAQVAAVLTRYVQNLAK